MRSREDNCLFLSDAPLLQEAKLAATLADMKKGNEIMVDEYSELR